MDYYPKSNHLVYRLQGHLQNLSFGTRNRRTARLRSVRKMTEKLRSPREIRVQRVLIPDFAKAMPPRRGDFLPYESLMLQF
jgi:hypothetical protein